jgi:two-component system response regulator NreC
LSEGRHKVTIVIADDHPVVRSGLQTLLDAEEDLEVLAEAADVEEALRKVGAHRPDVLVLDLVMPGRSPIDSIPELLEANRGTAIVVLTMQSDPAYVRAALRNGVSGYILKEAAQSALVRAVRKVADGGTYVDPELGARLAREPESSGAPDGLSGREAEVLGLVALGHTNHEIAEQLTVSVRTVEAHRAHIQQKLSFESRAALVRYAFDHGLVEPPAAR